MKVWMNNDWNKKNLDNAMSFVLINHELKSKE